jgi:transcriptional regulator with XRE-family HTH domain
LTYTEKPVYKVHMISIGETIRRRRKAKGLTQEDLGKAIGKDRSVIARYEDGGIDMPVSVIAAIAGALDVPVAEFFAEGGSEYPSEKGSPAAQGVGKR